MDHDPVAHRKIAELTRRIADLERRIAALDGDRAAQGGDEAWGFPDEPEGGPSAEVAALVADGKKLEAIKLYRQETGAGLKDAADAIDRLESGG